MAIDGNTILNSQVNIALAEFYCDYNSGNDSNPGTAVSPFKTVGYAISVINSQTGGALQKTFIINIKGGMTYIESGDASIIMSTSGINDNVVLRSWNKYTYGIPKIRKAAGANTWTLDANYTTAGGGALTVEGLDFYKYEMGNGGQAVNQSIVDSVVNTIHVSPSSGTISNIIKQCTIDGSITNGIHVEASVNLSGMYVYNCQITNHANYGLYVDPGATGILNHKYNNYYFNNNSPSNISLDTTELKTDPKYIDRSNGNYYLESDSQSINTGGTSGYATLEGINGVLRVIPDIGAYEYYQTIFYVRTIGGSGYYTTIQEALDTIYLQNETRDFIGEQIVEIETGTYCGFQPNSGLSPTNLYNLKIKSRSGHLATIEGCTPSGNVIVLDSVNYVIVDGVIIKG